jgi:hypothetical protein
MSDTFEDCEDTVFTTLEDKEDRFINEETELMFSCESLDDKQLEHIEKQIQDLLQEVRDIKKSIERMEHNNEKCTMM